MDDAQAHEHEQPSAMPDGGAPRRRAAAATPCSGLLGRPAAAAACRRGSPAPGRVRVSPVKRSACTARAAARPTICAAGLWRCPSSWIKISSRGATWCGRRGDLTPISASRPSAAKSTALRPRAPPMLVSVLMPAQGALRCRLGARCACRAWRRRRRRRRALAAAARGQAVARSPCARWRRRTRRRRRSTSGCVGSPDVVTRSLTMRRAPAEQLAAVDRRAHAAARGGVEAGNDARAERKALCRRSAR